MKNTIFKVGRALFLCCLLSGPTTNLVSQELKNNPILTGAPILSIVPDARQGAMGDAGVAYNPDVNSQFWNVSKYAFTSKKAGVSMSYTPWLRKVVDDVALMNVVGYYKVGNEDNQAISASLRYFKIGSVDVIYPDNSSGGYDTSISPYEMAFDIGYSRKLSNNFSIGAALRYIRVDYSGADNEITANNLIAADVSAYSEHFISMGSMEPLLTFGANISNITGSKISLADAGYESFIPTNLRLGAGLMLPISEVSTLSFTFDINKLLVPTRPIQGEDESLNEYSKRLDEYNKTGALKGIFKSFSDAPGGFSEEMKEITLSGGLEYNYNSLFMIRSGYFHQNKMKGNRQYFTFGAGVKYKMAQLDAAYVASVKSKNPLDQTIRLSLSFAFE